MKLRKLDKIVIVLDILVLILVSAYCLINGFDNLSKEYILAASLCFSSLVMYVMMHYLNRGK